VLLHRRELKLKPGEIVELNVEIWPGATHFEPGEGLRLLIQGSDVMVFHVMNCIDCRNIESQLFILGMNRVLIVVIISFIREANIRHPCYFLSFQLIERVYSQNSVYRTCHFNANYQFSTRCTFQIHVRFLPENHSSH